MKTGEPFLLMGGEGTKFGVILFHDPLMEECIVSLQGRPYHVLTLPTPVVERGRMNLLMLEAQSR